MTEEVKAARKKLTHKDKVFADTYLANGCNKTRAAIAAGYSKKTAAQQGNYLFRKPHVHEYIMLMQAQEECDAIANLYETRAFWTRVMRNEELDQFGLDLSASDRLKASEHLAKSIGGFIDKKEITGASGGPVVTQIVVDYGDDDSTV